MEWAEPELDAVAAAGSCAVEVSEQKRKQAAIANRWSGLSILRGAPFALARRKTNMRIGAEGEITLLDSEPFGENNGKQFQNIIGCVPEQNPYSYGIIEETPGSASRLKVRGPGAPLKKAA